MQFLKKLAPPHYIFFSLLAFVFLSSIFPVTDNDVWWHLKSGELIWRHKAIPAVDVFSYTIAGEPWLAFEWLSQLVLFAVYGCAGLAGLTVFKAFAVACIFVLMYGTLRERDDLVAWVIFAVAFIAMRDGLRERPQLFTYFFTALFMYLLRTRKGLLLVPLLEVLWVNLHGPAAIIGAGIAAVYAVLSRRLHLRVRLYLLFATPAAMFASPHGYKVFVYFYTLFHEGFNGLILEYRPPMFSVPFIPFFLLLALAAAALFLKREKEPADVAAAAFAAFASLLAIRNIPVFAVIAAPLAVEGFASVVKTPRHYPSSRALGLGVALCAVFCFAGAKLDVLNKYRFGTGDNHRCRYAARFIKDNAVGGPLFNDYDFGGYLIWSLYPGEKVFVDGRLVEYGALFVERSFYYWKPEIWRELEGTYGFAAAVIPQEPFYAASYLDTRPDWVLVYWDDGALVYVKDIPRNKALIARYGYRYIKPNSPRQDYLRTLPPAAVAREIDRSLACAPYSRRAHRLKTIFEKL